MPNWSDEDGRYWWTPPGKHWTEREIPHPPVVTVSGCVCDFCMHQGVGEPTKVHAQALAQASALALAAHDLLWRAGELLRKVDPGNINTPVRRINYQLCESANAAKRLAKELDAELGRTSKTGGS